ncbi:MAG: hypothetical protein ABW116_06790 [Candidatus Sedimenticola sp. 20ELBAFRAG]
MNYNTSILTMSMIALILSGPVMAGKTIQCPDLSQAKQLVDCPAEAEMERYFKKHCDFERDPDAKKPELCDSFKEYKRRKFNAMWESSDGEFMGYLSCDAPPAELKKRQQTSVAVSQKNGLYKIVCGYEGGSRLIMRTRSVCRVPGVKTTGIVMRAECGANGKPCVVECDE